MIKPILLYNCEIWAPTICNLDKMLEINTSKTQSYYKFPFKKMHMKWAKYILGVNNKSINIAITAELGRYPLIIDIMCTAVTYWSRMSETRKDSLLYDCYRSNVQSNTNGENCWLSFTENLANRSNFHTELSMKKLTKKLKTYLENVFDYQFSKDLYNDTRNENEGNKLRTYKTITRTIFK